MHSLLAGPAGDAPLWPPSSFHLHFFFAFVWCLAGPPGDALLRPSFPIFLHLILGCLLCLPSWQVPLVTPCYGLAWSTWATFTALLSLLLVLHIYWFYLILKVGGKGGQGHGIGEDGGLDESDMTD